MQSQARLSYAEVQPIINEVNGPADDNAQPNCELSFKGIPYADIIAEWWKQQGGEPEEGERNVKLYQLAVNLRAICDNNKALLLQLSIGELGQGNREAIYAVPCSLRHLQRPQAQSIPSCAVCGRLVPDDTYDALHVSLLPSSRREAQTE